MPSVYQLKPAFQKLLRPVVGLIARAGISANAVTLSAALLSAAVGVLIFLRSEERWPFLVVPVFLFIRMALNAIDGMLAREFGHKTRLGAVLNELGDVISDSFLYLPFAALPGISLWLTAIVVVLAVISEMAGVVAIQIGAARRYDGPMGKSDRAAVFGIAAFALGLGYGPASWMNWVLIVVAGLLVLSIVNRVRKALAEQVAGP